MNNCVVWRKFGESEVNIRKWQQIKEKLRNTNSSQKSFSGPKIGRYHELEQKIIEYVWEKRNEGLLITLEAIRVKTLELKCRFVQTGSMGDTAFKASVGWCVCEWWKEQGLRCGAEQNSHSIVLQNMQRNLSHINATWLIYDRLFGIVVSTSGYHPKGPGFDSRLYPRNFSGSIGSGTGSTQPCEDNWVATWYEK